MVVAHENIADVEENKAHGSPASDGNGEHGEEASQPGQRDD